MNRKVAHILAMLANIAKVITLSASFGTTTGAAIVTTATITVTVPTGNAGFITLTISRFDDAGVATLLYSINGAAFVSYSSTTVINVPTGQTLRFRMTGATPGIGSTAIINLTDYSAANAFIDQAILVRT
jgi:hypothetical protein